MKLYVLVRNDLRTPDGKKKRGYFVAQACHAVADLIWSWKFLLARPSYPSLSPHPYHWDNYMVVLQVRDYNELRKWERRFRAYHPDNPIYKFKEPDLHNKVTAMACLAPDGFFFGLKLL